MVQQILMVEDDDGIAIPLQRTLEREGYAVERVANGADGLSRVADGSAELVILDLGLPDMDGLEVCRALRSQGYEGGILILTARGGELDRVVGLDVGADDYLAKPFPLGEFLARVRALLRRTTRSAPAPGATADPSAAPAASAGEPTRAAAASPAFRVDADARRVWVGSVELALTSKEFDLLAMLDGERGKVLTRERLMDEVWDENWFGSTKTLDVTVGRLRHKLESASAPVSVVTVRGVGFRLEDRPPDA